MKKGGKKKENFNIFWSVANLTTITELIKTETIWPENRLDVKENERFLL